MRLQRHASTDQALPASGTAGASPPGLAELTAQGNQTVARTVATPATPFRAVPPPGATLARTAAPVQEQADGPTLSRKPSGATVGGHDLSDRGLKLIASFEGCRLTAYKDAVGVWTIGYGHTGDVKPGQKITQARAEELLRSDAGRFVKAVNEKVKVALNQNQFDALVSLSYNLGANGWSELLAKLNRGDYAGAQKMFGEYVHAGGKVLKGLVRRRAEEAELFGSSGPGGETPDKKPDEPGPGKDGDEPGKGKDSYTIVRGDTLSEIAERFGFGSYKELLPLNPQFQKNPDLIFPGQKVYFKPGSRKPDDDKDKPNKKPPGNGAKDAASVAARFLGRWANDLKRSKDIPMDPNVPNTVCCANFVSGVLELAGLISHGQRSNSVAQLRKNLGGSGWKTVGTGSVRPGDVIFLKPSHVEVVYKVEGRKITLIGSNNTNGGSGPQRVSEGNPYGSHDYMTPPN